MWAALRSGRMSPTALGPRESLRLLLILILRLPRSHLHSYYMHMHFQYKFNTLLLHIIIDLQVFMRTLPPSCNARARD